MTTAALAIQLAATTDIDTLMDLAARYYTGPTATAMTSDRLDLQNDLSSCQQLDPAVQTGRAGQAGVCGQQRDREGLSQSDVRRVVDSDRLPQFPAAHSA